MITFASDSSITFLMNFCKLKMYQQNVWKLKTTTRNNYAGEWWCSRAWNVIDIRQRTKARWQKQLCFSSCSWSQNQLYPTIFLSWASRYCGSRQWYEPLTSCLYNSTVFHLYSASLLSICVLHGSFILHIVVVFSRILFWLAPKASFPTQ